MRLTYTLGLCAGWLMLAIFAGFGNAAPAKPAPAPLPKVEKPADAPPIPMLPAKTNWGTIKQDGRKFTIEGNASWWGMGEIRLDGKSVVIDWINVNDGKPALGAYLLTDGVMHGAWGWAENVSETAPGVLDGGCAEVIREIPMEE